MSIQSISIWINSSHDYREGLELLEKYSSNGFLKRVLSKSETDYNRKKLFIELSKLNGDKIEPKFKISLPGEYDHLPDQVKDIKQKADAAFKEMRDLHSRLLLLRDNERAQATFRILDLEQICVPLWDQLKYFSEHKKLPLLPGAPKVKEETREHLIIRRNNVRSYISRGQMHYQAELDEINKKLSDA